MTAPVPGSGDGPDPRPGPSLRERYARIARTPEEELAADLLALTPTHEGRERADLLAWAGHALEFGREMADVPDTSGHVTDVEVTEQARGGVRADQILLAEYLHRSSGSLVVVYTDALDYAQRVASAAGWGPDYPRAAVRRAALAHEEAHRLLHGERGRALRRRIDHTALRIGPLRLRGHVVGADEIAAHAYAHHRCSLRRSPIALTAAIAASLVHRGPHRPGPSTPPGDHP